MKLTITAYSTALFSTWYFIEELNLLLDAGEGLTSALLHKARKVENVFITHADRDHLMGLHQFNQLNAKPGSPTIHYPKDCGSFPAMEAFTKKFDTHVSGTIWTPLVDGEKIWIKGDVYVQAIKNHHVITQEGKHRSFAYKVVSVKHKLKPELTKLPAKEIRALIKTEGKENTHIEIATNLLCYSGDTPVENFEHWHGSQVLIHEATFLGGEHDTNLWVHGNQHSTLEEVIAAVANINLETLILGHFSSRYSPERIDEEIKKLCKKYQITIPVYRILPGQTVKDILSDSTHRVV
ncbi:MAG: MBL fold metallo-hydrolase [Bacteroidia bacterium]